MLKLNKMSDYAAVVINSMEKSKDEYLSTDQVSIFTGLPLPTVSKILHKLSSGGIVTSLRGRTGGYKLSKDISEIPIIDILEIFEGPIVLTDCLDNSGEVCVHLSNCNIAGKWEIVSSTIKIILENLTLKELFDPSTNKDFIINNIQTISNRPSSFSNNRDDL